MPKFNKYQLQAIESPITKDVLLSAGAGSGKTKTLSEKAMKLITEGIIKPSELLVLTFTNNAAHEMKERIIKNIKDKEGENSKLALEAESSQILTFDSFAQYLVKKYSGNLKISENITIINPSVFNVAITNILDEILKEYYEKDLNKVVNSFKKYNLQDDSITKRVILDVYKKLESLTPSKRNKFLNEYENIYLSESKYLESINEIISSFKEEIKTLILKAYFIENNGDVIKSNESTLSDLKEIFKDKDNFKIDYKYLEFDDENTKSLYEKLRNLISYDGIDFIKETKVLYNDNLESKKKACSSYKLLLSIFKSEVIEIFNKFNDSIFDGYNKVLESKDDVRLILDIVKELGDRLFEYKRKCNSFTFQDVFNMALKLVTDEEYKDVQEKIRNQFKYIMVDEYQDSNDLQEEFIDSLTKIKKDGTRTHAFFVGDAKQSIYAFRNSNVEIFNHRRNRYESNLEDSEVIDMNYNYRSGKKLLEDINYIFTFYMTINHGNINYNSKKEMLEYDDEVDIYRGNYNNFGVYRLLPGFDKNYEERLIEYRNRIDSINNDSNRNEIVDEIKKEYQDVLQAKVKTKSEKEWEALAIINDIKKKVESSYLVHDRGDKNKLRPCRYSDFLILMRVKRDFKLYQKLFNENNIPLNNNISTNLYEIDSIILIQSLVRMISLRMNENSNEDIEHLFMSIARSYVFEYSDLKLHELITSKSYMDDEIIKRVDEFILETNEMSFSTMFTLMLNKFDVISKLYKIGNIDDNIKKIESLYQMVSSQEKLGEGLSEFINIILTIPKYNLELSADSSIKIEDAVDLMTIHASKGLENKIVYMPVSSNKLSSDSNISKPDYTFSFKHGILLPQYKINYGVSADSSLKLRYDTLYDALEERETKENDIGRNEHVRLFYVALTRAENSLYIVGRELTDDDKNRKLENLYGMISYMPHYMVLNESLIKKYKGIGTIDADYNEYLELSESIRESRLEPFIDELDNYQKNAYIDLYKNYYQNSINEKMDFIKDEIETSIFMTCYNRFIDDKTYEDIDKLSRFYGYFIYGNQFIMNFDELEDYVNTINGVEIDNNYDDEEYEVDEDENSYQEEELSLSDRVLSFGTAILLSKFEYFNIKLTKKQLSDKNLAKYLKKVLFDTFITIYNDEHFLGRLSYDSINYKDKVEYFDIRTFKENKISNDININDIKTTVNDKEIEFKDIIKKHASKEIKDEDLISNEVLERGTYLHRLMELVDLNTKDTSFIKDQNDRKLIDRVLKNELFNLIDDSTIIYKEYGYFDDFYNTTGYIDLMLKKNDEYYIIDYKSKHVEDDGYENQLHNYERNIKRIFNLDNNKIHLYLLSLYDNKVLEVKPDNI